MSELISSYLADLKEDLLYAQVKQELAAGTPANDIFTALQHGMTTIGDRYQCQEYFLSELIMAADIFKNAVALLKDTLFTGDQKTLATLVLGTVAGDIHDIGKDIVGLVFTSNGFKVVDLGVDVSPEKFLAAIKEHKPQLVGLSCLITTSFDSMKATVAAINEAGLHDGLKILIGGGPVDQATCDYVKADHFCTDAPEGVKIAKQFLGVE